ncbi:MAG: hypothetical protein WCT31_04635 [Candidatus Micrarchaeia archaeon]|jgi:hypothetical protein
MDLRKYVVIGMAALIASVVKIIFNLDIITAGFIFAILIIISYYTAAKTGYWKIPSKKPNQPTA